MNLLPNEYWHSWERLVSCQRTAVANILFWPKHRTLGITHPVWKDLICISLPRETFVVESWWKTRLALSLNRVCFGEKLFSEATLRIRGSTLVWTEWSKGAGVGLQRHWAVFLQQIRQTNPKLSSYRVPPAKFYEHNKIAAKKSKNYNL